MSSKWVFSHILHGRLGTLLGFFAFYAGSYGPSFHCHPFQWGEEVVSVRLGQMSRHLSCNHATEFQELKGRTSARNRGLWVEFRRTGGPFAHRRPRGAESQLEGCGQVGVPNRKACFIILYNIYIYIYMFLNIM